MDVATASREKDTKPLRGKSVRRTVEVLEYMSLKRGGITVMDITRNLGIPQSTTSELLAALVDIGVAAKDSTSRYYFTTPKVTTIGLSSQSLQIHNAKLFERMEKFAKQSGHLIGLFGINDANIQPYWVSGILAAVNEERAPSGSGIEPTAILGNSTSHLASGAAGLALLSSLESERSGRLLWRIRCEVGDDERFSHSDLCNCVQSIREQGYAFGASGFGMELGATAVLLPSAYGPYPLALAAFYPLTAFVDPGALAQAMLREIEGSVSPKNDRAEVAAPAHSAKQ